MEAGWFQQIGDWRDFYIFVGTAAATLMGLVFVVVSLGKDVVRSEQAPVRAFYTPIVVFFTTVIAVAMLMLIPKSAPSVLGALLCVTGASGLTYLTISGSLEQWRSYELAVDDLLFYVALPLISYFAVIIGAIGVWRATSFGLHTIAAVMILLLLIGVRNAWDLVIYIAQRDESGTD